jgi:hypothetical protein
MEKVYQIKKIMTLEGGRKQHVLMTDSQGEVFETSSWEESTRLCELMNSNTDSGWRYEIVIIGK